MSNQPNQKNKKVHIEGLEGEDLDKAQKIYEGAQEGEKMIPRDEVDFSQEGFADGAGWALRLVDTITRLITDQVQEEGLSSEVALEAIQIGVSDALVGVSRETIFDHYQESGGDLLKNAAEHAVEKAQKAVNGEVVGPDS